jgi:hypothetical protein
MKHLSVAEAQKQGYRSITGDLWPDREKDKAIIASMEQTLSTCDAVWMTFPYEAIQAARKRSELILPEDEVARLKNSRP